MTRAILIEPVRPQWYAVAFDIAGGIRAWSGPHRWRRARREAIRLEQDRLVRRARVQQWMPVMGRVGR